MDIAKSFFIFMSNIEIIAANNDNAVEVTIDINVSPTTLFFLELPSSLFSTITAAKPNKMVNTREKTVVSTSANLTST